MYLMEKIHGLRQVSQIATAYLLIARAQWEIMSFFYGDTTSHPVSSIMEICGVTCNFRLPSSDKRSKLWATYCTGLREGTNILRGVAICYHWRENPPIILSYFSETPLGLNAGLLRNGIAITKLASH